MPITTLERLVGDLQDSQRRQELVERLQALIAVTRAAEKSEAAAPQGPLDTVVAFFQQISHAAGETLSGIVVQVETIPDRLRGLEATLADDAARSSLLRDVALATTLLAIALGAFVASRLAVRRLRTALVRRKNEQPFELMARLWRVVLRLLLDCTAPLLSMLLAMLGLSVLPMSAAAGATALAIVWSIAATDLLYRVLDAVLAKDHPDVRPLPVTDADARKLANALGHAGSVAIFGGFGIGACRALGADDALLGALRNVYALLLLLLGATLVIRFRRWPHQRAASGAGETPTLAEPPRTGWRSTARVLARLWWIVALVYMFGLYALWVGGLADAFGTALRATVATLVYTALGIAACSLANLGLRLLGVELSAKTGPLPTIRGRIPRYVAFARVTFAVMVTLVVAGYVLEAWNIQALMVLQSTVLQAVLSTGIGVLTVLVLAVAVIDATTALTDAWLQRQLAQERDSAKLRTLVPLAQKAVKLVVWVLTIVTVMGQLGISIGPIVASIGVLGLAIGFGAQTLVKDVITGVFILLEDAVSVGDVIKIDSTGGVVEAINLRTIRLRDLHGAVHTIPYSTVGRLANLTKEFSYYLVECGVSYRENTDEVIAVLREVGDGLQRDPTYAPHLLAPLEVIGVDRFEDSAVIVRVRLKTRPGKQWLVGREFNRRMKLAFDERDIEIPFPHRTLYFGVDKQGAAPPVQVQTAPGDSGK